jgi:predicted ribonuclease YlaK
MPKSKFPRWRVTFTRPIVSYSSLTYGVDRCKRWQHSGHITLMNAERSRLADYVSEMR